MLFGKTFSVGRFLVLNQVAFLENPFFLKANPHLPKKKPNSHKKESFSSTIQDLKPKLKIKLTKKIFY